MTQILIVEDEIDIATVVAKYLEADGLDTHIITNGDEVIAWAKEAQPDLYVLDLMLPGTDGITLCRQLREFTDNPIIITTAKVSEIDRLTGFDHGADDYVCKPYSARELVARIKVQLRRLPPKAPQRETLTLLPDKLEICFRGAGVTMTHQEFKLFELLYRQPGRIYSREQILDMAYDDYRIISNRTIDSHIRNLRQKLKQIGLGEAIQSIYGAGYKFEPAE